MDFPQLFSTLFSKLALFITLATLQGSIELAARKYQVVMRWHRVLYGLLFGVFATVDMMNPVHLSDGVFLDTRNIIILVVTASHGRVTGLIVTLIVCAFRISLGGAGMWPALGAILTAYALGAVFARYSSHLTFSRALNLLGLGGALALLNLLWFLLLPSHIFSLVAAPLCILYPIGTYIMHTALIYSKDYVKLQQMLDHERIMLRTLIDNVPDYIHVQDANGKFLLANQAYADAAGLKAEAFLGKTLRNVSPALISDYDQQDLEMALRGEAIISQIRAVQNPGIGSLWMSVTRVPLRDEDGTVTGIISINHDMSESHRAEIALAHSENRYRSVVQNMVEGILVQKANGDFETVNPQAENILGLTRQQLTGKAPISEGWYCVYEDMTPIDANNNPLSVALRTGQRQNNVVVGICKPNGTLTWVMLNTEPLVAPNDIRPYAVITSFLDITERKAAEEHALRLAAEHERTEALHKFIRDISHDFRTPLSIMDLNVQLLQRTHKEEKSQHRFTVMQEQVQRIAYLLNSFNDVMTYDEGVAPEHIRPIEMNAVINSARAVYQEAADKKDQSLIIQPSCEALFVAGDAKQLQQAVDSLLQNAITFTPDHGTITLSVAIREDELVIAVQDNGIGISTEDLSHIFERFYRADHARSTLTGGSGIGLTLARHVATNHKGRIEVDSQLGQGSTFRLVLPLAQDPALMLALS